LAEEKQIIKKDGVLNEAREKGSNVTIILINGVQLKGKITSLDKFTVCLKVNGKDNLVYKHAVSTILASAT